MVEPKSLLENVIEPTEILRMDHFVALCVIEDGTDSSERLREPFVHQAFVLDVDDFLGFIGTRGCKQKSSAMTDNERSMRT